MVKKIVSFLYIIDSFIYKVIEYIMKKKSIEYIFDKILGVNEKSCDEVECNNPGIYSAPKSPNR